MHQDEGAGRIGVPRGSDIANPGHSTPPIAALNAFRKPRLIIIKPSLCSAAARQSLLGDFPLRALPLAVLHLISQRIKRSPLLR
jgi:hypothetical protein